jgi:hypothetical protein
VSFYNASGVVDWVRAVSRANGADEYLERRR